MFRRFFFILVICSGEKKVYFFFSSDVYEEMRFFIGCKVVLVILVFFSLRGVRVIE